MPIGQQPGKAPRLGHSYSNTLGLHSALHAGFPLLHALTIPFSGGVIPASDEVIPFSDEVTLPWSMGLPAESWHACRPLHRLLYWYKASTYVWYYLRVLLGGGAHVPPVGSQRPPAWTDNNRTALFADTAVPLFQLVQGTL